MIRVAVAGAGAWGMNHVRTMGSLPGAELVMVCDGLEENREKARNLFPSVALATDVDAAIASLDVDAIVLATPAKAHAEQARRALRAGKHVLVEKPLALSAEDAHSAIVAAEAQRRVLMVGHLMLYHPAVVRLRDMIVAGELGQIQYLYSVRVNLGRIRQDENALWSLAPHDISILDFLLGELPSSVCARGGAYVQSRVEDVVFMNLRYPSGICAQIQVSWLDPRKERRLTLVGSRKMAEFDDTHPTHKLRIFDKGVVEGGTRSQLAIRDDGVQGVEIAVEEPLRLESLDFIAAIAEGKRPVADATSAMRVVRVLEAAQESLSNNGIPIDL